jgi:glycosyltransferase involved in cell wall biosynthesis
MRMWEKQSVRSLHSSVLSLAEQGDLDLALRTIHDFVERVITEDLCTAVVFGSRLLDECCQFVGEASFSGIWRDVGGSEEKSHKDGLTVVYIVTKLQKSGGHSRVIESFIKARKEACHVILSTELEGKSDTGYILELGKQYRIFFEQAPKKSFYDRLVWLQMRLMQIRPEKVYLFNHHQDSVAVAAIQPSMKMDCSFFHHGDHHLCLGVYMPHLNHIDPHPMGYYNCRRNLGIRNTYVPLTVEDKGDRPSSMPFMKRGELVTCTAARSNKVEASYFVDYLEVVPKLLKATGGRHIHIGRLTPWAVSRIRRNLKRLGVATDRFIYRNWVPSVWSALHEDQVDLYIASFPYGGGLTLIEAMGAGVPVALHKHVFSEILSGIDLAYPGSFSWRFPEELLEFCSNLRPEYLERESRSARFRYLEFHRLEVLERILSGRELVSSVPGGKRESFLPETDEWACWLEREISFGRLIRRKMLRSFRRIRAKWA